jgi:hypothetical protein
MESVGNFGHFIADPDNQDIEMFVSDAQPIIYVDVDGAAAGHIKVAQDFPCDASPIGADSAIAYTQADGGACTMVETNGTVYVSNNWTSVIRTGENVEGNCQHKFELSCIDGIEQE